MIGLKGFFGQEAVSMPAVAMVSRKALATASSDLDPRRAGNRSLGR